MNIEKNFAAQKPTLGLLMYWLFLHFILYSW